MERRGEAGGRAAEDVVRWGRSRSRSAALFVVIGLYADGDGCCCCWGRRVDGDRSRAADCAAADMSHE